MWIRNKKHIKKTRRFQTMKNASRSNRKLEAITYKTIVVGIDIAKSRQWARFVDYRGMEIGKAVSFNNDREGFEYIVSEIRTKIKMFDAEKVFVGMEPTGHYWKPLANYLMKQNITVVLVNPYHTKKAKELDDNSQTKSDKKDALTIAKLVKDGRYYDTYMPHDKYADLRVLTTTRISLNDKKSAIENKITAVLDEYFPEFTTVFKHPYKGKAAVQILKSCPLPKDIKALGIDGVLTEIRKAVKRTVGRKTAGKLVDAANISIGVDYGEAEATFKIQKLVEELELVNKQLEEIKERMGNILDDLDIGKYLLSVNGLGVVTVAMLLGEIGDPLRFDDAKQISRLAGYNLIEDSSGKNKSGTAISKRGRKNLRRVLYQISLTMVATNSEMKQLYHYLKTRKENPLKKMQALVVIGKKVLSLIYALAKKKEYYHSDRVLGAVRQSQLLLAA